MPLTLNQALLLILTLAAVVAVTFLVISLIQLRKTATEGARALAEFRKLAENLNELDFILKEKIEDLGQTIEASKNVAVNLAEVAAFLTTKLVRPASKYWPVLFPLLRLLWRQMKKRKEKQDE